MKNGLSQSVSRQIACPACGKPQRVPRAGTGGRVQCGHCREKIDLPKVAKLSEPESEVLAALQQRVEALEKEVAKLTSAPSSSGRMAHSEPSSLPGAFTFAQRLAKCRTGRITVCFPERALDEESAAHRVSVIFRAAGWEVLGPVAVAAARSATSLAIGSLSMTTAAAELFMALKAAGVEVQPLLDQDLGADDACLTITSESAAQMLPPEDAPAVSVMAA